jgi:hypothetical protein
VSTRILRTPDGYPRRGPTQVTRTRPHACGRNCPLHDPLKFAAAKFLGEAYEVLTGTGAHAAHKQKQKGACVRCSCGIRVQGRLSRAQGAEEASRG